MGGPEDSAVEEYFTPSEEVLENEVMLSKLALSNRYMFVTNKEQLLELLSLIEKKVSSLEGLLVIMDGYLVFRELTATKINRAMVFFTTQFRQYGCSIIFITSIDGKLDRRIDRQLTHISKIESTRILEEDRG